MHRHATAFLSPMPSKKDKSSRGKKLVKSPKDLAKRIESVLTRLAKECLTEEPDDVERFCYDFLGGQLGARISSRLPSQPALLVHSDGSLENDACYAKLDTNPGRPGKSERQANYRSTDSDAARSGSDEPGDAEVNVTRIKSMLWEDGAAPTADTTQDSEGMFSMKGMTEARLASEVARYKDDERMKSLYRIWDGDNSGAIDLVELVVELHKFDEVSRDGKGIQVASEALVQCVNSDSGELDMADFSTVVVLFCHNIFKAAFDDVAEHLLAVAESTSEEAARRAADGHDVSEIEAYDKEEHEFLKETVKGIEDSINDNVRRLRTTKLKMKNSDSKGSLKTT